ncbi:MAG TPA: PEGA domain-containing protein [bacterium]|nr:PEGA domain-containing protein [bacterium]
MDNTPIKPIPPASPSSSPAQNSPSPVSSPVAPESSSAKPSIAPPSPSSTQATTPTPPPATPATPPATKPRFRVPANFPWLKIAGGVVLVTLALLAWISLANVSITSEPRADEILINDKSVKKTSFVRMPGSFTVTIKKEGYLTYKKPFHLGFNGKLTINPTLKPLPVAEPVFEGVTENITIGANGGIKSISTDGQYLIWARPKSGNDKSLDRVNMNLVPLPGISEVQYPDTQNFALIVRGKEVGVLDFSTPDASSQDYAVFSSEHIGPIALSPSGKEVFYWQYIPELDKNFLVRNNPAGTKPDRYFDQALIDQLDIKEPEISWSPDSTNVLMVDRHIVLLGMVERAAKIISYEEGISKAFVTPNNNNIVAIATGGDLLTIGLTNGEEKPTPQNTKLNVLNNNLFIKDNETVIILDKNKQLIGYNFAQNNKIVYLIDEKLSLDENVTMAVDITAEQVYFWKEGQVYRQPLVSDQY